MSYLANFQELRQSVSPEVLFFPRKQIQWLEREKVPIAVVHHPDLTVALREPLEMIQNWSEVGASTVHISQAGIEWPERLYSFALDPEAFNDYRLIASSATSLDLDEAVDTLEQFDKDWLLDGLDQTQEKFCISEEISDEMIVSGMIKHDFIVQMPPIREYTLRVRVKSIEKATPHIVEPEGI